ncbi:MAG: hypothetical protein CVU43_23645 [Chloroflexi bacterium HGW-Chloroflexi-5]|jgi:hypothetical protein|nr:MAG: hypothetical protein CVU43_23645 [Chloroflexi bacterium HGW-Chloroflexi-5]
MPRTKSKHTDQLWQRIDSVVNLILENDRYLQTRRSDELSKIVANKFSVSRRTAERYIVEARNEIRRLGKIDKKKAFEKCMRRFELLFNRSLGIKNQSGDFILKPDHRLARDLNNDIAKINQLFIEESKSEVTVKNIDLSKFTEHGLERLKRGDSVEEVLMDPKAVKQE